MLATTPLSKLLEISAGPRRRVGLYFGAGWCPMCTSFEPNLAAFRRAVVVAEQSPIDLLYVSSDDDATVAEQRAKVHDMQLLPPDVAAELKRRFRVWAGREVPHFGADRRSGVPAIVVLDPAFEEVVFLDAEARGPKVLGEWPDDHVWGS